MRATLILTSLLAGAGLVAAAPSPIPDPVAAAEAAAIADADAATATQRVLINPGLWPYLKRYTAFSAASEFIGDGGPGVRCKYPPYKSKWVHTFNISISDTQASLFRDDVAKEFVLAFPGSKGPVDWQNDGNYTPVAYTSPGVYCPGCHVHGGFLKAWNSAAPTIRAGLTKYMKGYPGYTITPTGHSLGGALTTLCFAMLHGYKFPVKHAYTFGQPRVFDFKGAAYINYLSGASKDNIGQFIRSTHTDDGVPQSPSLSAGYWHSLTEIYQLDTPSGSQSAGTTWRCFGAESTQCNRGEGAGHFIDKAHGMYSSIKFGSGYGCSPADQ